ncbi:hypothetical protein [Streptomyces californicus]|uniref:hypothetical protein n=1 Tax=Streptomyces californicus TaxID=67351 RepID=UPI0033DECAAF
MPIPPTARPASDSFAEPGVLLGDPCRQPVVLRQQRALGGVRAEFGGGVPLQQQPGEDPHPALQRVPPLEGVEARPGAADGRRADRQHGQQEQRQQRGVEDAQDTRGAHQSEEGRGQGDDLADDLPRVEQSAVVGAVRLVVPVRVVDDLQPHVGGQREELRLQRGTDLRCHAGLRDGDARLQERPGSQEADDDQELGDGRAHPVRRGPLGEEFPQHRHRGHQPERRHRGRRELQEHDRERRGPVGVPGQPADPAHDAGQACEELPHRRLGGGAVVDGPVRFLQAVGDVAVVLRPARHDGGRQRKSRTARPRQRSRRETVRIVEAAHERHPASRRTGRRVRRSNRRSPQVGVAGEDRRRCSNPGRRAGADSLFMMSSVWAAGWYWCSKNAPDPGP